MKLRVLGCSGGIGGIGGRHLRTSSFLVDHDILIDAGTGVAELSVMNWQASTMSSSPTPISIISPRCR